MRKLLLVACLMMFFTSVFSQNYFKKDTIQTFTKTPNIFIIKLKDGTRLKGKVIEQNTEKSRIQTENMGVITVQANQIVSMELDNNQSGSNGTYYENRFLDRIHLAPTAFPMNKGDVDYHNYYLYYNEISAALGSKVSVGFGTALIPFVPISSIFPYNLKVKATLISTEKVHFSVNGYLIGFNNTNAKVIIPTLSIGKKDNFFNIAPLFYFGNNDSGSFGLSLGYMKKVSPNLTFFSENFFGLGTSTNKVSSVGGGLRFDRKRHAFDLSLNMFINNERRYTYSSSGSTYNNELAIRPIPSVGYHLKLSK